MIWSVDTNTDQFRVIHKFTGGRDGRTPEAGVTVDGEGNLYGTSLHGTGDADLVYRFRPALKRLNVLYKFQSGVEFAPGELLFGSEEYYTVSRKAEALCSHSTR